MKIAVVVPTIRPECMKKFMEDWKTLFSIHDVVVVEVVDGDDPTVNGLKLSEQTKKVQDLIYNKNDGVRNFGFWFVAKHLPDVEYVITLDDDVAPVGDTVFDHIRTLQQKVTYSWCKTTTEYTRGFPYSIRNGEKEVVLSHGLWQGVADWDAPTQLIRGNPKATLLRFVVPKGVYYPMCGMNIAFKRKMLPYMYFAPMGPKVGLDRFADIWCGINSKRIADKKGWAVVSGGAIVSHKRASNVFKNLQKEARGLELNETYWQGNESDPYFKLYKKKREAWQYLIQKLLN